MECLIPVFRAAEGERTPLRRAVASGSPFCGTLEVAVARLDQAE